MTGFCRPPLLWCLLALSSCVPATFAAAPKTKPSSTKNSTPHTPPQPTKPPEMRMHFLDVGQGAATLLEFPCGAMLVDTGGEQDDMYQSNPALLAYLKAFFARRSDLKNTLDLVLLTHPHIDHVRGAPTVLENFTVRNFVENGQTPLQDDAIKSMSQVHEYLSAHPDIKTYAVNLDEFSIDGSPLTNAVIDPFASCKGADPKVEALWGRATSDPGWGEDKYGKSNFDNQNNHSVVTRVDFGESSLLITGDLEEPAIRSLLSARSAAVLDVDIYEVGHHGSHNGTTSELMQAMTPEWAVMEVGPFDRKMSWTAWAYGHPRQVTYELLEAGVSGTRPSVTEEVGAGVKNFVEVTVDKAIYATGWDGTVVLTADTTGHIERCTPDYEPAKAPAP